LMLLQKVTDITIKETKKCIFEIADSGRVSYSILLQTLTDFYNSRFGKIMKIFL